MIYRTSHNSQFRFAHNFAQQNYELANLVLQLVSGQKINKPSTNPSGAAALLSLKGKEAANKQDGCNLAYANLWLGAGKAALDGISASLKEIEIKALQGATDSSGAQERLLIAVEIEALTQNILSLANSKLGDHYLFSGQSINTRPFPEQEACRYQGDSRYIYVNGPNSQRTAINVPGSQLLGSGEIFLKDLQTVSEALKNNDSHALGAALNHVTAAQNHFSTLRVQLGRRFKEAAASQAHLEQGAELLQNQLQLLSASDCPQVICELKKHTLAYETYLGVTGLLVKSSLADYL